MSARTQWLIAMDAQDEETALGRQTAEAEEYFEKEASFKNWGGLGASMAGAKVGASIGSMVAPGLGTLIGSALGAGIGYMGGAKMGEEIAEYGVDDKWVFSGEEKYSNKASEFHTDMRTGKFYKDTRADTSKDLINVGVQSDKQDWWKAGSAAAAAGFLTTKAPVDVGTYGKRELGEKYVKGQYATKELADKYAGKTGLNLLGERFGIGRTLAQGADVSDKTLVSDKTPDVFDNFQQGLEEQKKRTVEQGFLEKQQSWKKPLGRKTAISDPTSFDPFAPKKSRLSPGTLRTGMEPEFQKSIETEFAKKDYWKGQGKLDLEEYQGIQEQIKTLRDTPIRKKAGMISLEELQAGFDQQDKSMLQAAGDNQEMASYLKNVQRTTTPDLSGVNERELRKMLDWEEMKDLNRGYDANKIPLSKPEIRPPGHFNKEIIKSRKPDTLTAEKWDLEKLRTTKRGEELVIDKINKGKKLTKDEKTFYDEYMGRKVEGAVAKFREKKYQDVSKGDFYPQQTLEDLTREVSETSDKYKKDYFKVRMEQLNKKVEDIPRIEQEGWAEKLSEKIKFEDKINYNSGIGAQVEKSKSFNSIGSKPWLESIVKEFTGKGQKPEYDPTHKWYKYNTQLEKMWNVMGKGK